MNDSATMRRAAHLRASRPPRFTRLKAAAAYRSGLRFINCFSRWCQGDFWLAHAGHIHAKRVILFDTGDFALMASTF